MEVGEEKKIVSVADDAEAYDEKVWTPLLLGSRNQPAAASAGHGQQGHLRVNHGLDDGIEACWNGSFGCSACSRRTPPAAADSTASSGWIRCIFLGTTSPGFGSFYHSDVAWDSFHGEFLRLCVFR